MNFDKYAKEWDNEARINRASLIVEEIKKAIPLDKSYSAMEFGCGTGLISFNLQNEFKRITLVDASEGMIEVVNSKINRYKVDNMKAKKLDIFKEPLKEKYDVIYTSMVLHHIEDTKKVVKIFYDYLNEGGYLCIVDLNTEDGSFHASEKDFHGHNGFDQEEFKKILMSTGFKKTESKTFFEDKKNMAGKDIEYSLFILKGEK
ncbi:class I SAM-dependent DNA methyltransferase [Clostridium felsineum]|uniref:class I SAM-dependent DNA methyltransferase n=1 Tax=Clostridium felsineum TaxID=36839 RepID=UPI00098C6703|nr:class I SAM-dependent methyltransferase [Clostridium felsineum]URZ15070.1 tRNA 5-carboxymethoxyuridine methyltransferase [Clostridium felsineum DSM 794]